MDKIQELKNRIGLLEQSCQNYETDRRELILILKSQNVEIKNQNDQLMKQFSKLLDVNKTPSASKEIQLLTNRLTELETKFQEREAITLNFLNRITKQIGEYKGQGQIVQDIFKELRDFFQVQHQTA